MAGDNTINILNILFRDDYLVAIDKPAGLLVHRTGLDAGETRFALQLLRDQIGQPVWPVHRLDKGTSGVLLFALDAATARDCGLAFESGKGMDKTYHAIVRGWPPAHGHIDHPLRRMDDDMRKNRDVIQDASTTYNCIARYEIDMASGVFPTTRCARMVLHPLTGRRHQLRRHLKHIAHPIVGDATHGKGPLNRALAEHLSQHRLWLHAQHLSLKHPITGQTIAITAPPGPEWACWTPHTAPP